MSRHHNIILHQILSILFLFQPHFLFAQKRSGSFEAKVDWTCAPDSIQVRVHTLHPFHGIIHPSGFPDEKKPTRSLSSFSATASASSSPPCAIQGNGTLTTRLQIALHSAAESAWDECGLQLNSDSSTLWLLLEIHEHPLVMLGEDRTVNISCTDWSPTPNGGHSSNSNSRSRSSGPSSDAHNLQQQQNSDFRLAIVSTADGSAATDGEGPLDIVWLGAEYNLSVQAVHPLAWPNIFVHSCSAISSDNQHKLQLIDSDGCSMDRRLIADFEQSNRRMVPPPPTTTVTAGTTKAFAPSARSSGNDRTVNQQQQQQQQQQPPFITVATAQIPTMFRFNTQQFDQQQQQQRRHELLLLNSGNVIHFECTVERCEQRGGGTVPTALTPCQRTNCDRKRTIIGKELQQTAATAAAAASVITTSAPVRAADNDNERAAGAAGPPAVDELELVTQLLRAQHKAEEEEGEEVEEEGSGAQVVAETEEGSPADEMAAEDGNAGGVGGRAGEGAEHEPAQQHQQQKHMANRSAISGEIKQQPPNHLPHQQQQLQLVHRHQKQLQVVRNAVRVFDGQQKGVASSRREGTVPAALKVPPMGTNDGADDGAMGTSAVGVSQTTVVTPSPPSYTEEDSGPYHNNNPSLFINDSMEFGVVAASTGWPPAAIPMAAQNSFSPARIGSDSAQLLLDPSAVHAAPSSGTTHQPSHQQPSHRCVSAQQLSQLYMVGIALCALFLLGCLFNLLMCCLGGRRRTAPGAALPSPFRTKRGRRPQQHPQQKMNAAAGGHSSHTTLTSSLYGNAAINETKIGPNGGKVGFWINEDEHHHQRNGGGGGTIEYAPMVSSFYEGMPNVHTTADGITTTSTINNTNNNNGPQRRLSVHSYASVKQRGTASQLFCKMPMPTNNNNNNGSAGAPTMVGHQQQLINQQQMNSNMSSSSYSPSTTASSSTSGGGATTAGPLLSNDNNAHQQYNHQQYHQPLMRSTFHPPPTADSNEQQQQQHSQQQQSSSLCSSVASSVRSSTTLDGPGGPSCSQSSTVGDDYSDIGGAGCGDVGTTPRPCAIVDGFATTIMHHPQQQYANTNNNHNNNNANMNMAANNSSTFRCPRAVDGNTMMVMNHHHNNNNNHLNESFSIL